MQDVAKQRDQLEAIQRRAVRIIFGNEVDLESIAIIQDIPLLADRRDRQTRQMYIAMHDSSHCLYRLLLENSVEPAIHTLHKHKNYRVPFARTSRFINSFLLHALRYFQWTSVIYFDLLTFCAVVYMKSVCDFIQQLGCNIIKSGWWCVFLCSESSTASTLVAWWSCVMFTCIYTHSILYMC